LTYNLQHLKHCYEGKVNDTHIMYANLNSFSVYQLDNIN